MNAQCMFTLKPLGCLRKCLPWGGPTAGNDWTRQLLRGSALLLCPSLLKITSLPLMSAASLRLAFYAWLHRAKGLKLSSTVLQDYTWGVHWLSIDHLHTFERFWIRMNVWMLVHSFRPLKLQECRELSQQVTTTVVRFLITNWSLICRDIWVVFVTKKSINQCHEFMKIATLVSIMNVTCLSYVMNIVMLCT